MSRTLSRIVMSRTTGAVSEKSRSNGALVTGRGCRAGSDGAGGAKALHSALTWWRWLPAEAFSIDDIATLLRAMRAGGSITDPRWPAALQGDAHAAVAIAVQTVFTAAFDASADLAMTAVLRCAVTGDEPAAMVMAAALRQRAAADPRCGELEASWYVAHFSGDELWRRQYQGRGCAIGSRRRDRTRH